MPEKETEHQPIVSHGRGGQGNIGADSTQYVDAEIIREGPYGDQGDGPYSAGRGGAGNINTSSQHGRHSYERPLTPTSHRPHDSEVIPEVSLREPEMGDYHVGRGGQGNVHLDEHHPHHHHHHHHKKDEKGNENENEEEKNKDQKEKAHKKSQNRKSSSYLGLADRLKDKLFGILK